MSCRAIAGALVLLIATVTAAQNPPSRPSTTSPGPTRVPDYSHLPDTFATGIEYQKYDKAPLTFSTTTQYVLVPVVVTDKAGNPVRGLKREDFRLQENGKDQKIASFEEFQSSDSPVTKPQTAPNESTNRVVEQDTNPRRLVIIALDMVNTPFTDQGRARQQLIQYLSQAVEPGSLYQLVAVENNGLRMLHDFTQDTSGLIAALKKVRSRLTGIDRVDSAALQVGGGALSPTEHDSTAMSGHVSTTDAGPTMSVTLDPEERNLAQFAALEQPYAQLMSGAAASSTLAAFQQIALRCSGIPGRKSLVWVTGSFPFSIDPATASLSEGMSFAAYQHVMQTLSDQMIAVYPVDARGLLVNQPDASEHLSGKRVQLAQPLFADISNRQRDIVETMRAFADMTGGHAYFNTNDTLGAVRDAAHDGASYYLVSYPVDKSDQRAGWRKIAVKVGDYNVRARKGYYLTQSTVDLLATARNDIDSALASPFDYTGLPLRMVVSPVEPNGATRKLTFNMVLPPNVAKVDGAENHMHLEIAYRAFTATGQDAGHKGVTYNLKLNAAQMQAIQTQGVAYGDTLELAPGTYKLRAVMRDNLTGRIGSVQTEVKVQ